MNTEPLIQLIQIVSESNLTEFHYEEKDMKLILKRNEIIHISDSHVDGTAHPVVNVKQESLESAAASNGSEEKLITSPLVGIFYSAPAEDAAPYVQIGETVKKGQTIAIVEAMKLMNEIESEFDGRIKEIFVKNGQAIEYGQPLFSIE